MKGSAEERLAALDALYPIWEEDTLWSRFVKNSERYSERPFLICQEEIYTYSQVREESKRLARSLFAAGVRPGDHVAVFLYNSPVFIYMIFALSRLGAVKVPVNIKLGDQEKQYILEQSEASWAIGMRMPGPDVIRTIPGIRKTIALDEWDSFLELGNNVPEETIDRLEAENRNPYGISDIMYTSGSTSFPKGVMLTHDMLLRSSYGTCRTRLMEEGRRLYVPLPFYHIFAYSEGILPMMHVGGTVIISDRKFDVGNSLYLMKKHSANDIICVPVVMIELLRDGKPKPEEYPHMHAAYWASTCPDWVWDEGKRAFGITDVTTGYGMTECGSTSTILSPLAPEDYVRYYVGSLKDAGAAGSDAYGGRLIELKICSPDTGEMLPAGETGEIYCRGLTVTPGYYKNKEANEQAFVGNGWFRTGDLGVLNKDGLLKFCGRKSDMYKINGENVSPQFVDSVIGQCPGVEQVEVVGMCHEKYGEVGVAFIDAGEATEEKKREIQQYVRQNLAHFQVPRYFVYESQKEWPRTSTGKVRKSELGERAWQMFHNCFK